jgi:hypothetical protein
MTVPARSAIARSANTRSALQSGSSGASGSGTTLRSLVLIVRDRILETLALVTPGPPLVSPQRTTGTTTYAYVIVALNAKGHSAASDEGMTAYGFSVLAPTSFQRLTWTPVPRATGYAIYRTQGGHTQGLIATVGAVTSFDDQGSVADGATPPSSNTSGTLGLFWSDEELLHILVLGAKDLWRAFIDLHQEHFFTDDVEHVTLPANSDRLSGVPANVHRVLTIEPLDDDPARISFVPRDYNTPSFRVARRAAARTPENGGDVLYAVTGAGAPTGAPTIYAAPRLDRTVPIRLVYIPTLSGAMTFTDTNPVPGESDAALVAYTVAFALAKDREDRSPDPNWLAVYTTEKNSCLVASAPRQEQVPPVVTGVFDDILGPGLSGFEGDWDDWD